MYFIRLCIKTYKNICIRNESLCVWCFEALLIQRNMLSRAQVASTEKSPYKSNRNGLSLVNISYCMSQIIGRARSDVQSCYVMEILTSV